MHNNEELLERAFIIERQEIYLSQIDDANPILDIGGGGEGIISKISRGTVVAIDYKKEELEECDDDQSIKIIMDARKLNFLDRSFNLITAFFTFLYIDEKDIEQVLSEIYRVLKVGGKFIIWDASLPDYKSEDKDIFVVPLLIHLPDQDIETGYGIRWNKKQSMDIFIEKAKSVGLKIIKTTENGQIFKITFTKTK